MRTLLAAVLTLALTLPVSVSAQEMSGDWTYESEQDPMTDEQRSFVYVDGNRGILAFGFACVDEDFMALVELLDSSTQIGLAGAGGETTGVQHRFGKQEPDGPNVWWISDNLRYVAQPDSEAVNMAENATEHDRLAVRVFDPDGKIVGTDTFGLNGAGSAIGRLACFTRTDSTPDSSPPSP